MKDKGSTNFQLEAFIRVPYKKINLFNQEAEEEWD